MQLKKKTATSVYLFHNNMSNFISWQHNNISQYGYFCYFVIIDERRCKLYYFLVTDRHYKYYDHIIKPLDVYLSLYSKRHNITQMSRYETYSTL